MRGKTPGSLQRALPERLPRHFTNVSEKAGILRDAGYGLGVVVADLNGDGWPDIYVSNDVIANDVVYVNNGDGTFTNKRGQWLKHTSFAGMGVDIADFNNDGWPDILQVDMMPRDAEPAGSERAASPPTAASHAARSRGFRDDYSENSPAAEQRRHARDGDVVFSEIARLAGVSSTPTGAGARSSPTSTTTATRTSSSATAIRRPSTISTT